MSTSQQCSQHTASATYRVPLLVNAEATNKHQVNTALPTEESQSSLTRSIQSATTNSKQKQKLNFCPVCNMLLKKVNSEPPTLRCKCGYRSKLQDIIILARPGNQKKREIAVIDKEKGNLCTHDIVKAVCEKCGRTKTETWTIPVGSEGSISAWTFMRCVNCGYTHREVG